MFRPFGARGSDRPNREATACLPHRRDLSAHPRNPPAPDLSTVRISPLRDWITAPAHRRKTDVPAERLKERKCNARAFSNFQKALPVLPASARK